MSHCMRPFHILRARAGAIALGLLALVAQAKFATAQGWETMDVGSRVSIRVSDSLLPPGLPRRNAVVGLVAGREDRALFVRITSRDTVRIPRDAITHLWMSRGKSARRSALRLGLIEGFVMSVLPPVGGRYFDSDHLESIAIGAVVGGAIGALWAPEEWKRIRP